MTLKAAVLGAVGSEAGRRLTLLLEELSSLPLDSAARWRVMRIETILLEPEEDQKRDEP